MIQSSLLQNQELEEVESVSDSECSNSSSSGFEISDYI